MSTHPITRIILITGLALNLCIAGAAHAEPSRNDTPQVIRLAERPPPALKRYLGWRCSALLRNDYSRFNTPHCGAHNADVGTLRELQVSSVNQ